MASLSRYSKVSSNSNEWSRIEYLLQLALGTTTATLRHIYSVSSPHNTKNFEKKNKGKLTLDSWIETALLDQGNKLDKVLAKGFDFPTAGLLFPTGHLTLSESTYVSGKLIEVLLCKISVGKSYCMNLKNSTKNTITTQSSLPPGFDSIYLVNDEDDPDAQIYKHDFILYNNTQVLPVYLVQFEFDPKKEEALAPAICDYCQESSANFYCINDDVALCSDCNATVHNDGSKILKNHKRVDIKERPKNFGICHEHNQKFEFYCNIDHAPLCVYCKITGSHSTGDMAYHQIVRISDAYSKSLEESRELDPLLEKKKNQITESLSLIDGKIKEVNKCASRVEEELYQILLNALNALQFETQKKMNLLISDQLEFKRQYEQIQWLESFLKYQQEVLQPADYLNSWSKHLLIREEILNHTVLPILTEVLADLRVDGKLTVVSTSFLNQVEANLETMGDIDFNSEEKKFRSQVFFDHNLSDKASQILKQIIGGNLVKGMQLNSSLNKLENIESLGIKNSLLSQGGMLPKGSMINEKFERVAPRPLGNQEISSNIQKTNEILSNKTGPMLKISSQNSKDGIEYIYTTNLLQDSTNGRNILNNALGATKISSILNRVFVSSTILTDREDAKKLFLNIPFTNPSNPPETLFILGQSNELINMANFIDSFRNHNCASFLIFKVKDEIFGGYASDPWVLDSKKNLGNQSCFLFNLKRDIKCIAKTTGNNEKFYQWMNEKSLSWGDDLEIDNFTKFRISPGTRYTSGDKNDEEAFGIRGEFIPSHIELWILSDNPKQ